MDFSRPARLCAPPPPHSDLQSLLSPPEETSDGRTQPRWADRAFTYGSPGAGSPPGREASRCLAVVSGQAGGCARSEEKLSFCTGGSGNAVLHREYLTPNP